MTTGLNVLGVLLILVGGVWALQGLNIIGGSFMTGETQWLVIGIGVIVVGVALLARANFRRPPIL